MELQPVVLEQLTELVTKCIAEDFTECLDGQEESRRRVDPSGTVEAQAASGDDVMDVGMMLEVLSPTMEHAEEPYDRAEVSWVTGSFEQRRGTGAKEQIVKQPLVLEDERGELVGQGEDDMEVRHGQQLCRTRGQPPGPRVALAPGAVPVAARVIGDGLMATADALIEMPTQCRGAATDDGIEHLAMRPCKVRSVLLPEAVARCADDVGHLEGGPIRVFLSRPALRA